jgi:heptosyltransferase-2
MHLLVILPRWVGDVVMCTPMLRALRRRFRGDARITAVVRPGHDALLAGTQLDGTSWIDDYLFYNLHSRDRSFRLGPVARRLREHPADAAIIVPNSLSSAALAWLAGARRRIGFSRNGRRLLLTDPLRLPWKGWKVEPSSTAAAAMQLAERLGVAPEPLRLELATSPADRAMADVLLSEMFGTSEGPLVILNDNAATGTSRAWGHEPFAALARMIVADHPDARVLVHCGPDDRQQSRRIVEMSQSRSVRGMHDIERLPFGLSKAIIERARLLVSSDSGPRHIAAAFGIPTVAVFVAADPRLGRSDHPGLVELRVDLPCVPCNKKDCPLGHRDCMRLLRVEDVYAAAAPALE